MKTDFFDTIMAQHNVIGAGAPAWWTTLRQVMQVLVDNGVAKGEIIDKISALIELIQKNLPDVQAGVATLESIGQAAIALFKKG